jgi:hypothetical protein
VSLLSILLILSLKILFPYYPFPPEVSHRQTYLLALAPCHGLITLELLRSAYHLDLSYFDFIINVWSILVEIPPAIFTFILSTVLASYQATGWMTEDLEVIFSQLGMIQYLDAFVEQGFDTWDTVLDITESDLYAKTRPIYSQL